MGISVELLLAWYCSPFVFEKYMFELNNKFIIQTTIQSIRAHNTPMTYRTHRGIIFTSASWDTQENP